MSTTNPCQISVKSHCGVYYVRQLEMYIHVSHFHVLDLSGSTSTVPPQSVGAISDTISVMLYHSLSFS